MSTPLPSPTPRTTYLTPLFRWLHTPVGRSIIRALIVALLVQGVPLGQLPWHTPGSAFVASLAEKIGLLLPSAHSATPVFGPGRLSA